MNRGRKKEEGVWCHTGRQKKYFFLMNQGRFPEWMQSFVLITQADELTETDLQNKCERERVMSLFALDSFTWGPHVS